MAILVGTLAGLIVTTVLAFCRGPISTGFNHVRDKIGSARVRRACQRGDHDWRLIIGSLATGEMVYACKACGAAKTDQLDI